MPGKNRATGMGTDDHDVPDVQWITTSASDAGAEDTSIPAIGQIGVLLYINSEPYLIGFFRTMQPAPQDVPAGTEEDALEALITEGDRILTTIGGNSVILRSGGSIEIRSTAVCRTFWLPTNLMTSVCGDFELDTDGGYITWERTPQTNDEMLEFFIQDNLEPENCIDLQLGTTEAGNLVDLKIGAVDIDDFTFTNVQVSLSIDPDGNVTVQVGNVSSGTPNASLTIEAATGNTTYSTQGSMTMNVKQDLTATVQGDATVTVTGDINATTQADANVTASGTVNVKGEKILLNGELSGVTTENSHYGVVDFITGVPVEPSMTTFSDV
jgi:hypothetical protein